MVRVNFIASPTLDRLNITGPRLFRHHELPEASSSSLAKGARDLYDAAWYMGCFGAGSAARERSISLPRASTVDRLLSSRSLKRYG
jgi:hypothetical protein